MDEPDRCLLQSFSSAPSPPSRTPNAIPTTKWGRSVSCSEMLRIIFMISVSWHLNARDIKLCSRLFSIIMAALRRFSARLMPSAIRSGSDFWFRFSSSMSTTTGTQSVYVNIDFTLSSRLMWYRIFVTMPWCLSSLRNVTSFGSSPTRIIFARSRASNDRLNSSLSVICTRSFWDWSSRGSFSTMFSSLRGSGFSHTATVVSEPGVCEPLPPPPPPAFIDSVELELVMGLTKPAPAPPWLVGLDSFVSCSWLPLQLPDLGRCFSSGMRRRGGSISFGFSWSMIVSSCSVLLLPPPATPPSRSRSLPLPVLQLLADMLLRASMSCFI
uniref:Uncharacterized protein n=1 Tax=Anopheles coluzzii TaxID=1518534 RepID=A0A8W7P1E2_ANOCL